VRVNTSSSSSPQAPGMLISHYAPRKKFVVGDLDNLIEIHRNKKIAVLSFSRTYPAQINKVLSPTGDLHEAAKNLFAYMRELDTMDLEVIIAEFVPEVGIGLAINDKLRRASARYSIARMSIILLFIMFIFLFSSKKTNLALAMET
jgi:L-threonylcarbamoyladenylate synthase